jgi:hypothetical protein
MKKILAECIIKNTPTHYTQQSTISRVTFSHVKNKNPPPKKRTIKE